MYGRVIHLNPVKWTEGWPVIGEDKDGDGCGEPVRRYRKPNVGKTYPVETPAESDEFNSRTVGAAMGMACQLSGCFWFYFRFGVYAYLWACAVRGLREFLGSAESVVAKVSGRRVCCHDQVEGGGWS